MKKLCSAPQRNSTARDDVLLQDWGGGGCPRKRWVPSGTPPPRIITLRLYGYDCSNHEETPLGCDGEGLMSITLMGSTPRPEGC